MIRVLNRKHTNLDNNQRTTAREPGSDRGPRTKHQKSQVTEVRRSTRPREKNQQNLWIKNTSGVLKKRSLTTVFAGRSHMFKVRDSWDAPRPEITVAEKNSNKLPNRTLVVTCFSPIKRSQYDYSWPRARNFSHCRCEVGDRPETNNMPASAAEPTLKELQRNVTQFRLRWMFMSSRIKDVSGKLLDYRGSTRDLWIHP